MQHPHGYSSTEVIIREGDLSKPSTLTGVVKDIDVVVHLAAMMDFYPTHIQEVYRVNVDGTRNLLDAFTQEKKQKGSKRLTRFIYISSTETIGAVKEPPGDEKTPSDPVYDYGISKVMAENLIQESAAKTHTPWVILRPTGTSHLAIDFVDS